MRKQKDASTSWNEGFGDFGVLPEELVRQIWLGFFAETIATRFLGFYVPHPANRVSKWVRAYETEAQQVASLPRIEEMDEYEGTFQQDTPEAHQCRMRALAELQPRLQVSLVEWSSDKVPTPFTSYWFERRNFYKLVGDYTVEKARLQACRASGCIPPWVIASADEYAERISYYGSLYMFPGVRAHFTGLCPEIGPEHFSKPVLRGVLYSLFARLYKE